MIVMYHDIQIWFYLFEKKTYTVLWSVCALQLPCDLFYKIFL